MNPFNATKRALKIKSRSPMPLSLKFEKSISMTKIVPSKIKPVKTQSAFVNLCLNTMMEIKLVNNTSAFNSIAAFEAVESCNPKNAVMSKENPKIPIKSSFGNTGRIFKRFF